MGSGPVPTNGRHPPKQNVVPTGRRKLSKAGWVRLGDLSKAGWVRLRGRKPHGPEACLGPMRLTPRTPTPPASDRFPLLWVGVDLGRHGRSTPCVDAFCSILEIFDFDEDSSTHGVDLRQGAGNCRRRGGWRGCPRHGCRGQAYRDVLAASPSTGPTPPSHGEPAVAVAVAVAVASAGAGRSPAKENSLPHGHCISPLATFALSSSDATPASFG